MSTSARSQRRVLVLPKAERKLAGAKLGGRGKQEADVCPRSGNRGACQLDCLRKSPAFMARPNTAQGKRSEEHTSELQSLMRMSYAVFCLKKKNITTRNHQRRHSQSKYD